MVQADFWLPSFSGAMARFISPIDGPFPDDQSLVQPVGNRPTKNIRRKVASLLSAQQAIGQDPRVRHGFNRRRSVLAAKYGDMAHLAHGASGWPAV